VEEKGMTSQRLAQQARQRGFEVVATKFDQRADEAFRHADALRGLVLRAPTDAGADERSRCPRGSEAEREPAAEPPDPQGAR
jgi:hypothetical protein